MAISLNYNIQFDLYSRILIPCDLLYVESLLFTPKIYVRGNSIGRVPTDVGLLKHVPGLNFCLNPRS